VADARQEAEDRRELAFHLTAVAEATRKLVHCCGAYLLPRHNPRISIEDARRNLPFLAEALDRALGECWCVWAVRWPRVPEALAKAGLVPDIPPPSDTLRLAKSGVDQIHTTLGYLMERWGFHLAGEPDFARWTVKESELRALMDATNPIDAAATGLAEPVARDRPAGGRDPSLMIEYSEHDYTKAIDLEPPHPGLLDKHQRDGSIHDLERIRHGRWRFWLVDDGMRDVAAETAALKERIAGFEREHKQNRARGAQKRVAAHPRKAQGNL
jgi:hypothetical protein